MECYSCRWDSSGSLRLRQIYFALVNEKTLAVALGDTEDEAREAATLGAVEELQRQYPDEDLFRGA